MHTFSPKASCALILLPSLTASQPRPIQVLPRWWPPALLLHSHTPPGALFCRCLSQHCRCRQLSTNLLLLSSQEWEIKHLYVTLFSSKKPFRVPFSMFRGHSGVLNFAPSQASGQKEKKCNKSFCESLSSTHNASLWFGTLFRQILLQGFCSTEGSLLRV